MWAISLDWIIISLFLGFMVYDNDYSRGGHEIEKTIITQETQEFLDRFNPPEDNSPTSCVLIFLVAISVMVVVVLLWGASTPPFISKGGEVIRKDPELVIIVVLIGLYL
jgi:hypothetical protein